MVASSSADQDQSKTVMGQPMHFSNPPAYQPATSNEDPIPFTPPPAAYYSPEPYQWQPNKNKNRKTIILIVVIVVFILLAIFTFASDINWLVLRPKLPVLQIHSLLVSNFHVSVSQSLVTANWAANFTAENPNESLNIVVDASDFSVFYESDYLSWMDATSLPDVVLEPEKKGTMSAKLERTSSEQYEMEKQILEKIAEDRKRGRLSFNLRMDVIVIYMAGKLAERRVFLQLACNDLKVEFVTATGDGMFTGGRKCEYIDD